ncbi:MAG: SpoIIE family protein phosphatase [Clostridia bacterium]|nr:SpoIIE family protein phosphatase [Clostridia bacterium]
MKQINLLPQRKPLRAPFISDVLPTVLLLFASRATVMGMSPFSAAFFAAAYDKRIAYIGIIGSLMGIATSAGIAAVPKYLIILIASWLILGFVKKENTVAGSVATAISVIVGGGVMLLAGFNGVFDIFLLITEAMTSALMFIIFKKAESVTEDFHRRRGMTAEEYVSVAITVGVMLSGLSDIGAYGITLTHILASYILLVASLNTTVSVSACTGLCIGFMSSMSSSDALVMMGVYGFGALFASFMNTFKRIGCVVGFICAISVMLIYAQSTYEIPGSILNAAIGGLLFLVTPRVIHEYLRSFFTKSMQVESVNPTSRMREYLSMRLIKTAEAFSSLHECFFSMSEGRLKKYSDDIGIILDETAERVCNDCKMCGKCWQTDFRKTYKNMLELIGIIEHEGMLNSENVPAHFGEKCERTARFINEINHVYELYKRDVLRRSDAVTTRNLISMQYNEINKLFSGMAGDVEDGFMFMEDDEERIVNALDKLGIIPYEISVIESTSGVCEVYLRLPPAVSHSIVEGAVSDVLDRCVSYEKTENGLSKYVSGALYEVEKSLLQLPRDGYGVNGDSVAMFTVGMSKFYCIIADGMGSGSEAQYESATACRLLTSFLKSGFSIKTALGILNSSMCLNMENEMYSTIDLLCVDLYTAEVQMYKIGSAQTLMLNGGEIKTITSSSVPAGILSDIRLDKKTVAMKEGDVILMMSDGITESGYSVSRTEWIKKIMVKPFESMDELAKEVMDTAIEKNNGIAKDDMSIVALRILSK